MENLQQLALIKQQIYKLEKLIVQNKTLSSIDRAKQQHYKNINEQVLSYQLSDVQNIQKEEQEIVLFTAEC